MLEGGCKTRETRVPASGMREPYLRGPVYVGEASVRDGGECPGWRRVPGKWAGMRICRMAGVRKAEVRMSKDLGQWGAGLRHPRTRNG